MDKKSKELKPIPIRLFKAIFGSTVLFLIPSLVVTFIVPSFTIELTRVNQERVDATVIKNLILMYPFSNYTATNLLKAESKIIDGGLIREGNRSTGKVTGDAEDEGLLLLKSERDVPIEVYISPKNLKDVTEEVQYFISESKEPSLRLWVTSNWKFGVLLPGGILLFGLLALLSTVWAIIKEQPLRKDSGQSK